MLKKFFYFAVGLADIFFEKFDDLASTGEERLTQYRESKKEQEIEVQITFEEEMVETLPSSPAPTNNSDDLTKINGIGPTFAKRLNEAGITTYQALAAATADQLREVTKAADWQANPEEWIQQAHTMS